VDNTTTLKLSMAVRTFNSTMLPEVKQL